MSTPSIFICYRHEDEHAHARLIALQLIDVFGKDEVYFDVKSSAPGRIFNQEIEAALESCVVLLAVIGPAWLTGGHETREGLGTPDDDYIVWEIGTALTRGITVIPVLVHGAQMPGNVALLPYLPELAERTSFEMHDTTWDHDLERLTECVREAREEAAVGRPPGPFYGNLTETRKQELEEIEALVRAGKHVVIQGPPGIGKGELLRALDERDPRAEAVRRSSDALSVTDLRSALHPTHAEFPENDAEGAVVLKRSILRGGPHRLLVHNVDQPETVKAVLKLVALVPRLRVVVTTRGQPFGSEFEVYEPSLPSDEECRDRLEPFELSERQLEEVLLAFPGNPLYQAAKAHALKTGRAMDTPDHLSPVAEEIDDRAVWLIGSLPSRLLEAGLLREVGRLDFAGVQLVTRHGVLTRLPDFYEVHSTLAQTCKERAEVASDDALEALYTDAARHCAEWLATASFEEADAARDNLIHLLKECVDHEVRADLALTLIGDHFDDPNGYMPKSGLASLLLEEQLLEKLLATAQTVNGLRGAQIEKNLGLFLHWANKPRAWPVLLSARAKYLALGKDVGGEGYAATTWILGYVADDTGRLDEAERRYNELLEPGSFGWLSDPSKRAVSQHLVGCSLYHQERYDDALLQFEEAMDNAHPKDHALRARIERRIAYVQLAHPKRDTEAAARRLEEVWAKAKGLKRARDAARCTRHLGTARLKLGDVDRAIEALELAVKEFETIGDQRGRGAALCTLAAARRKQDRLDEARDWAVMSRNIARGAPEEAVNGGRPRIARDDPLKPMWAPVGAARADAELGRIAEARGDSDEAARRLRQACNIYDAIGHPSKDVLGPKLKERGERDAKPPPHIKGVVFDLVDTLAITRKGAYERAKHEISDKLGVDHEVFKEAWADSREEASKNHRVTTEERILEVAKKLGAKCDPDEAEQLAVHERRLWHDEVVLKEETRTVLQSLEQRGIAIVLMANGSHLLKDLAERLELTQTFLLSCIIGTKTPERAFYRRARRVLELEPEQCMYVGDGGDRELEGAKLDGMFAVRLPVEEKPPYNHSESLDWHATVKKLEEVVGLVGG
ncbi:MAG TPA: HAD family hydrolase [Thermoleophilaceae bacterium]